MGRRSGQAQPPGVGGKDGKISKALKAHYARQPRTDAHNRKIGEGVSRARAKKQDDPGEAPHMKDPAK